MTGNPRMVTRCYVVSLVACALVLSALPLSAAPARLGQVGAVRIIIRGLSEQPPGRPIHTGKVRDPLYNRYFLRTQRRQKTGLQMVDGTNLYLNQSTDVVLQDSHTSVVKQGEIDQVDKKGTVGAMADDQAYGFGRQCSWARDSGPEWAHLCTRRGSCEWS